MRPYLAIISDSFRAAFASRLLWIVLGSILLMLVALAPIGYHEVHTVEFTPSDIHSTERLSGLLAEAMSAERPTAASRVAEALPATLREQIRAAAAEGAPGPRRREYIEAFNALLTSDDWYSAELWEGTARLGELRELDAREADELDPRLRERRARLRLEAAFAGAFRLRPERSLVISYAGMESPAVLPLSREQFVDVLNQFVFPLALYYLLGVGAVFVGVLVTAPIIPEMLQPGSLHLLLSKPLSRPGLYLAKFVGGCAFVLLCVALLVVGLWLISGFRLSLWNHRLLYCIPVFVFLFAVYYSVSALAALHWRSAIVAVVITVLFWFGCFAVGLTGGLFDTLVTGPAKVQRVAVTDQTLLVSTASGGLLRLAPTSEAYDPIIPAGFANRHRILGPVVLTDGRIVAARIPQNQFNVFGSEDLNLMILDPATDWAQQTGLQLPVGTRELQAADDGGLFAAGEGGLFYAPGDSLVADPEDQDEPRPTGGLLGGIGRLLGNTAGGFTRITPPSVTMTPPSDFATIPAAAMPPAASGLILYSRGRLVRLAHDVGAGAAGWSIAAESLSEGDLTLETRIAATAEHVVIARRGEPLRVFATETLEPLAEIPFPSTVTVVRLHGSPAAEQVVATLSDRRAALVRFGSESPAPGASEGAEAWLEFPDWPSQDDIEAVAWADDGTLWLAHHIDALAAVDAASGGIHVERRPDRDVWRLLNAWLVTPLRSIVPQTGELSETVTAIICGREDLEIPAGPEVQREQLDVVRPLATCGVFTAVMLLLGCLYVYRQDF